MARVKSKETIERENLIKEISDAMDSISGKSIIGYSDSAYLFSLYDKYYNTTTPQRQYTCDLCVIRILGFLGEIRSKYKESLKNI